MPRAEVVGYAPSCPRTTRENVDGLSLNPTVEDAVKAIVVAQTTIDE